MKFDFVATHRRIWPVTVVCGVLGLSRSGFYAWLTRRRGSLKTPPRQLSF